MPGAIKLTKPSTRTLILGTLVLVWFFSFTYRGILADFSADDVMNLDYYYQQGGFGTALAALQVTTAFYRPLGGLFYLGLYRIFGLNPLPFRLVCFALLLANMILFYRFFRLLSGRSEVAWLGLFLVSFHAWFVDLYYSSGTIYELLCVFFYLLAFTTYAETRSSGKHLSAGRWLLVGLCYAAALDAKELAVTLPLLLGFYELVYHRPGSVRGIRTWILGDGGGLFILAAVTIPYVWMKTAAGTVAGNPLYKPKMSALVFMHTFQIYLNPFFYLDHVLRGGSSMVLLGVLLLVALITRKRHLLFGWLFLILSPLPFIFIPHYAAFFFYLPALGWALVGAGLLVMLGDFISTAARVSMNFALPDGLKSRALVFGALLIPVACLAVLHGHEYRKTLKNYMSVQIPLSPLMEGLRDRCPDARAGTTLWFWHDPFPKDSYALEETVRLTCRDRGARVVRGGDPPEGNILHLRYDGRRVWSVGNVHAR